MLLVFAPFLPHRILDPAYKMIGHCVSRHFLYIVVILTPHKEPGNGTRKIEYTLSTDGTDDSSL